MALVCHHIEKSPQKSSEEQMLIVRDGTHSSNIYWKCTLVKGGPLPICSLWRAKKDLCLQELREKRRKTERSSVLPRATSKRKRRLEVREKVRNAQYMKHKHSTSILALICMPKQLPAWAENIHARHLMLFHFWAENIRAMCHVDSTI